MCNIEWGDDETYFMVDVCLFCGGIAVVVSFHLELDMCSLRAASKLCSLRSSRIMQSEICVKILQSEICTQ